MNPTRRNVIKFGLLAGAAAALPVEQAAAVLPKWFLEQPVESPPIPFFAVPLRIPPVLKPTSTSGSADVYNITQRIARVPIVPGLPPTTVWGYNGIVPGPTIHQRQGRDVQLIQHNALPVPITTHLHGGDVPASSDGHPLLLVPPGASRTYFYPGLHPAAPLWYHDHAVHDTGRNVYMGLAGNYFISDKVEDALHLPGGPHDISSAFDIPLTIQDRFFLSDGSIVYPRHDALRPLEQGVFGDVILVNGTPRPFMRVERRKYRFRILNGCNARVHRLRLSTGEPLVVIQSDGGLMPRPVPTGDLMLSASERYSVVIDFSGYKIGTQVVLQNVMEDIPGDPFDPALTRSVMRFDVVGDAPDPSRVPADLVPVPADIRPVQAVAERTFEFARNGGEWTINDQPYDPNRIDAFPKLGTNEIWTFINGGGGWWHPIHVHLIEFLVLSRTRRPVESYERGPKDTVLLKSNETVSVAIHWDHFTGLYVMHCHNVEHEDHDMMINIKVVK